MTGSVAAVVVTFNRPQQLLTVLARLVSQTQPVARIVVVDNASDAATAEALAPYVRDPVVEVLRLSENSGGAGGFAAGIAHATSLGADDVWLMDDDCYPEPDALQALIAGRSKAEQTAHRTVPFVCSVVRWTDGSLCEMNNAVATWDWVRLLDGGEPHVLVESCSFVSVLIPTRLIRKHGLPLADYFIWFDDVEFTRRLSASEGPGVQVLNSHVVHDLPENRGVNFAYVNASNVWKFRYGARNMASWHYHHENRVAYLAVCRRILSQMHYGRVPAQLRAQILRDLLLAPRFNPQPSFPT